MKDIVIKSASDKAVNLIESLQKSLEQSTGKKIHRHQILDILVDAYENGQLIKLDNDTMALLKQASDITGISQTTIVSKGTRFESKKLITNSGKLNNANIQQKSANMRFAGVARERINKFVAEVMETNLNKPEEAKRITQSFIFKKTGCNMKAIKEYLNENKVRLEEHYKEIGLDVN